MRWVSVWQLTQSVLKKWLLVGSAITSKLSSSCRWRRCAMKHRLLLHRYAQWVARGRNRAFLQVIALNYWCEVLELREVFRQARAFAWCWPSRVDRVREDHTVRESGYLTDAVQHRQEHPWCMAPRSLAIAMASADRKYASRGTTLFLADIHCSYRVCQSGWTLRGLPAVVTLFVPAAHCSIWFVRRRGPRQPI